MSILDFAKILEVKRYSRNTIERYVSVVKMAQQRFKKDLNLVNETEPSSNINTKSIIFSNQKYKTSGLTFLPQVVFFLTYIHSHSFLVKRQVTNCSY